MGPEDPKYRLPHKPKPAAGSCRRETWALAELPYRGGGDAPNGAWTRQGWLGIAHHGDHYDDGGDDGAPGPETPLLPPTIKPVSPRLRLAESGTYPATIVFLALPLFRMFLVFPFA